MKKVVAVGTKYNCTIQETRQVTVSKSFTFIAATETEKNLQINNEVAKLWCTVFDSLPKEMIHIGEVVNDRSED